LQINAHGHWANSGHKVFFYPPMATGNQAIIEAATEHMMNVAKA